MISPVSAWRRFATITLPLARPGLFAGMCIVFIYIWLPYMILPIQAAVERVPANLIDADRLSLMKRDAIQLTTAN